MLTHWFRLRVLSLVPDPGLWTDRARMGKQTYDNQS